MGARSLPGRVAAISPFALARCPCAANCPTGFPGWPAWPASPWAADWPGRPCGPLGTSGVDWHRAVGTVRTLRPIATRRTVRALSAPRPVRGGPIGAGSAVALGGAGGTSAIVVAVRGRTWPLGRAGWSPRTALVIAARPVGAAVATFWAAPGAGTCQLRRDPGGDWGRDELDAVRVRTLDNTGGLDRNHGDALDAELRLGTHNVACFCPTIKKSSIDRAARV